MGARSRVSLEKSLAVSRSLSGERPSICLSCVSGSPQRLPQPRVENASLLSGYDILIAASKYSSATSNLTLPFPLFEEELEDRSPDKKKTGPAKIIDHHGSHQVLRPPPTGSWCRRGTVGSLDSVSPRRPCRRREDGARARDPEPRGVDEGRERWARRCRDMSRVEKELRWSRGSKGMDGLRVLDVGRHETLHLRGHLRRNAAAA